MKKIHYYLIGIIALLISLIFDKQISLFFTSHRINFLNVIAIFIDNIKWYILFGIVLLILLIKKQYKKIFPLIISLILYLVLTNLIKVIVKRPRPYTKLDNALVENSNPESSFPSGHATSMFTLVPFMDFIEIFWIILSILVSLSRVYLGVHYLSDIIAGALLGYFIGDLSIYIIKGYKKRKPSHRKI